MADDLKQLFRTRCSMRACRRGLLRCAFACAARPSPITARTRLQSLGGGEQRVRAVRRWQDE
eukprot:2498624-Pleurochrysis_carterae.AAC.1